ncbi:MAG: hypothetical protein M1830_002460 [Pleopsidium flavum]|nr:MAG: hypothetical protein M1830_002460 [Pleopsidium flavum]
MARLNDPPPPIESIDALKRRFVRQNRELTKVNTTQSLRIRSLEVETSRLLSENLGLREQIIRLQHELQQNRNRHIAVGPVKGKLEAKLEELGKLVSELGIAQNTPGQSNTSPRRTNVCPARSPDQKNWKNALTLSEVTSSQDGRLPPILEDKYYPRRTMNAEELVGMLSISANPADSPDLGPPPVAHFDSDPIKFDASPRSGVHVKRVNDGEDGPAVLSANLETRRKRKEGSNASELGASRREGSGSGESNPTLPVKEDSMSSQQLNPGAKRKLSSREEEEPTSEPIAAVKDDFKFSRRQGVRIDDSASQENDGSGRPDNPVGVKISEDLAAARGMSRSKPKDATVAAASSARKALEPKSANTDPVSSPGKTSRPTINDKISEIKKEATKRARDRDRYRERKPAVIDIKPPEPKYEAAQASPELTEPPPETPAALDLFSPQSSEPSAARPESRDTPPPVDLNPSSSTADAFSQGGRASRRPRGGVSYAEPNLRDKMRRPTKALADAVGAEERIQRANSAKAEGAEPESDGAPAGSDNAKLRTVLIKKVNGSETSWKHLPSESNQQQKYRAEPTSPLGDRSKTVNGDLPPTVMTERRHRIPSNHRPEEPTFDDKHTSASGTAIAALVAGSRKPRETDRRRDVHDLDEAIQKVDIYEFHGSSPPDTETTNVSKEDLAASRSSRRHSAMPSSSRHAIQTAEPPKDDAGPGVRSKPSSRSLGRRRGTMGVAAAVVDVAGKDEGSVLGQAQSIADLKDGSEKMGRAERAASRRRSMML